MSETLEARWRKAVSKQLGVIEAAVNAVDATCPRTRYPWWQRLRWRLTGEPADVRARKYHEAKRRAELLMAELHGHRGEHEA